MSQKGHTPDERFLLKLYEIASAKGDPFQKIESTVVAKAICYKETAVKNIINMLAQTNFIKKIGDSAVCLTKNGYDFVHNELQ
jgi:hypothetical protein